MGCFLIGITGQGVTTQGEALLGSVSDDPYDIRTFMKFVGTDSGFSHLGTELISTTDHSLIERGYFANPGETTRGINEAGLAFTCAMVFEKNGVTQKHSAPFNRITTKIMEECETVNEAIDLFSSMEAISPAYSVLLADAKGHLAHIEVGSYGTSVYASHSKEHPGAIFAVNCYLTSSLYEYNDPKATFDNLDNNNRARLARGKNLVEVFQGKLDVDFVATILSDHENRERDPLTNPILPAWGFSICNHGTRSKETFPIEDLPWGTVSAEILQPEEKMFWYCYGWPCGEKPEYGDQIYQENSWGKFIPFGFSEAKQEKEMIPISTPQGEITKEGNIFRRIDIRRK